MPLPGPLRRSAALLRLACAPKYRVRVSLADTPDRWGDCALMGARGGRKYFLIRLHRPASLSHPSLMVWVLAHEWAHALSWDTEPDDHGPEFGLAYARAARALALE